MPREISSKTELKATKTFAVTGSEIIEMFKRADRNFAAIADRASNIKVEFHVPSGGDYSDMDIDIDDESPVLITIETVEKQETGNKG